MTHGREGARVSGQYDVAVAWRIYPNVSLKPLIHGDDKLALVATCLRSFLKSVRGLRVSYYFILDGCPAAYEDLIDTMFAGEKHVLIKTPRIGNKATFAKQVEVLLEQTDAPVVYFAEDDYLYKPDEFKKIHEVITSDPSVDFISCYCHRDIFTHPLHQHARRVKWAADHLWLSVNSTCLTFMTTKHVLEQTRGQFLTYCSGNHDCSVWLGLTKTHVLNPGAYLRFRGHAESRKVLRLALTRGWRQFLFSRTYSLYVPFPGIGTHLEGQFVSPETDWLTVARDVNRDAQAARNG